MLLQHGGDDDQLCGFRHACLPALLRLCWTISHHGSRHPWRCSPTGEFFIIKIKMCDKSSSQVATLVSITLAIFGLDASSLKADRVISKLQSPSLLTGFLRLSFVYNAAFNSMRKLHCVLPDSARPALASGQACWGLSPCWER